MKRKLKQLKSLKIKKMNSNTNKQLSVKDAEKDDTFKLSKITHLDLITEDVWDFMTENNERDLL